MTKVQTASTIIFSLCVGNKTVSEDHLATGDQFPPDLEPFDLFAAKTRTISVRSADDIKNNFITGGTYIPDNHILLVDCYNGKLKIFDQEGILTSEHKTEKDGPCDAAYDESNNAVLVTLLKPPCIAKYELIENTLKKHSEIILEFTPYSISILENELLVASVSGILVV